VDLEVGDLAPERVGVRGFLLVTPPLRRPGRIRRALGVGLRQLAAVRVYVLLAYAWNLVLAAVLAAVMFESIRASLGSSLAGDRMRAGWDSLWYYGFSAGASGVAATLKPSVVGIGAILDGLDSFLDGFAGLIAGGVGTGVLPLAILYLLSWTFLGAGFLGAFAGSPEPGFLARAARHFPRLLAVSTMGLVAYWVVLGPLRGRLDGVRDAALHDVIDERVRFAWTASEYLALWALVCLVNVLLDYTKVFLVRSGERSLLSPLRATKRALVLVFRHPAAVGGLYVLTGLFWLTLLALYAAVAPGAGQSSAPGIAGAFLLGQFYLVARIAIRCFFYASETALSVDLGEPPSVPEAA
jgi:hypothetical protein